MNTEPRRPFARGGIAALPKAGVVHSAGALPTRRHWFRASLVWPLSALLGCTVGPLHQRPDVPLPAQFQAAGQATTAPGTLLWSSFGSAELDRLIARALHANNSIAEAAARLQETRALSGLTRYAWFPTVTAEAAAERSKPSGRDPFIPVDQGTSDSYRAGFDASWEIDLFGSLRSQAKAIRQRVEADAATLADVRLAVVAETAQSWFALLGARSQLRLRELQQANLQANLRLVQRLLDNGRASSLDLARAQSLASSHAAELPAAAAEVQRQQQRLAVLTDWPLQQLREQLTDSANLPVLPALRSLGTPADWLQRRPDIRAAEARLAAATADVGYQQAQYFPLLNLLGDAGWTAQSLAGLGSQVAERWSFGPTLSWRFLDFGRVKQHVSAAEARREGAIAAYRQTVLLALEDSENALAGLRAANRAASELARALAAATEADRLARRRLEAGASNVLDVLQAERELLDLQQRELQARVARATALAAVYKAFAGDFAATAQGQAGAETGSPGTGGG